MSAAAATQQEPAGIPLQMQERTYFFMLNDPYEAQVGLHYLKTKYPGSKAKRVTDLRVDRITEEHTIICLKRINGSPSATQRRSNVTGLLEYENHAPETKYGEVVESEPIRCKTFWVPDADLTYGAGDGHLKTPDFIQAVSAAATPWVINWKPDQVPGILRLATL